MIKAGIQLITGFQQAGHPAEGVGIWALHDDLALLYRDRRDYWLSCDTWDCDAKAQAHKMVRRGHDTKTKYVDVGYSYGAGRGVRDHAAELDSYGKELDLVIYVDPVPRFDQVRHLYPLTTWRSLFGRAPLVVPGNVKKVVVYWTLNKKTAFSPRGRDVIASNKDTRILQRTVFGSKDLLVKWRPKGRHVVDPDVNHSTIDGDERVRVGALDFIKKELAS